MYDYSAFCGNGKKLAASPCHRPLPPESGGLVSTHMITAPDLTEARMQAHGSRVGPLTYNAGDQPQLARARPAPLALLTATPRFSLGTSVH